MQDNRNKLALWTTSIRLTSSVPVLFITAERDGHSSAGRRECGGDLHLVMITDHVGRVLYEHPLPYLDSG